MTSGRPPLPGHLLRRIPRVAAEPRWGGGLSRRQLAAAVGYPAYDQVFIRAVWCCYRRGEIDFCGAYVVPSPTKLGTKNRKSQRRSTVPACDHERKSR